MKAFVFLLPIVLFFYPLKAQIKDSLSEKESNQIFIDPEVYPEFPGGEAALHLYIKQNLIYPDSANEIQETVWVQFTIEDDGRINDVSLKRKLNIGCDKEAIRLIMSMPKWKPASVKGKAVKMKYQIPVKFGLQDN